jgi:hypothetical protein
VKVERQNIGLICQEWQAVCVSRRQLRHFLPRRTLESHGPFRHLPIMETPASSFKLRANTPDGWHVISYQQELKAGTAPLRLRE